MLNCLKSVLCIVKVTMLCWLLLLISQQLRIIFNPWFLVFVPVSYVQWYRGLKLERQTAFEH